MRSSILKILFFFFLLAGCSKKYNKQVKYIIEAIATDPAQPTTLIIKYSITDNRQQNTSINDLIWYYDFKGSPKDDYSIYVTGTNISSIKVKMTVDNWEDTKQCGSANCTVELQKLSKK